MSAKKALENYYAKLAKQNSHVGKKKSRKPEKDVERFCLQWMREKGWDVQILEAKASFNPRVGRYLRNANVATGTCDCIGTLPTGRFIAVEFKAPGRLSTFAADHNHAQRDYLIAKIMTGSFGCVTDSVARLQKIYDDFEKALEISPEKAKQILLGYLPKKTP